MEKGQSLSKANKAMLVAEEKESTEGASSPSSFLPKPTKGGSSRYDVFLSFNGSDTRKEFIDQLYHRLGIAGICVFRDYNSIRIGEEFTPVLLDAITCSKISIPIISEHYASSKWCLRKLIHIMDCKKSNSHIVLPIFYKVDPSYVQHLKRNFGEAFHSDKHRFYEKDIEEGRQALKDASNLPGWKSDEFASGHEGDLIERVVETVLGELRKYFPLFVPKELVGLDNQLREIMSHMDSPSANARMMGIYGMGGIGKTTLAKCIYNQLSNKFDHVCFLPDIRETTECRGIEYLQSRLISELLQEKNAVSIVDLGINLIKSRFTRKNVLILLDDIDRKDQLDALAGEGYWFASGSIIIVTTRNKAILDQSKFKVNYKYEMKVMDELDSLILFDSHAFQREHPLSDFADISRCIISTLGGLPLALKVVGSYLYKKTNPKVWDDMSKRLQINLYRDIQGILEISYDALEDGHKEIFLDIASFFIDKKIEFATYMWDDCKFYASQGIEELKLRCLIKIEDDGTLSMHDHLRNLGRNIIHRQQPLKHSRLWVDEEAFKRLMEKKRAAMIETSRCDEFFLYPFLDCGAAEQLQTHTNGQFKMSQRLRFLRLGNTIASEDLNEFFSQVRWLQWPHIELNLSFPATDLHLPKLAVLQLSYSSITDDWKGWNSIMAAKRLQVIQLEYFDSLRCTLDFSAFTELEILIFKNCKGLMQVHPSIGEVKSLVYLDLSGCSNLKELPREVGELEELKELILDNSGITKIPTSIGYLSKLEKLSASKCRSLTKIPSSIWDLHNLQSLHITHSPIEKLPNAIIRPDNPNCSTFTKLEFLNLSYCRRSKQVPPTVGKFKSLIHLDLGYCNSLKNLPREVGELEELREFILDFSGITEIPMSIGSLRMLENLSARGCRSLRKIPNSIGNLQYLQCLDISESLISDLPESIRNLSSLQHLTLWNCDNLRSLPVLPLSLKYLRTSYQGPILPELSYLIHLERLVLSWKQSTLNKSQSLEISNLRVASTNL